MPKAVVFGASEVIRAFGKIDVQLRKDLGNDLKEAAAPVVDSARTKVTVYSGASVNTIRSRRAGARVWVEQGARKVTGKHPEFGRLQMVHVLIPARDEHTDEIFEHTNDVLNRYANIAGFYV